MDQKTEDIELRLLLEAIYQKYDYDFRQYAMASVKRRLKQACEHFRCASYSALQDLILRSPKAFSELFAYLTVQVSEMFRDPSYFKALRNEVIPHLRTYPSLKIWVAGCSAGEELYSLVILFREEGLEERTLFYATDINHAALQKAEAGIYEKSRIALFDDNYRQSGGLFSLSDYYKEKPGGIAFHDNLKRHVVFSDHSLVSDSVFAEMQLISCRNVLIYFTRDLQNRALGLFKDSLSYKGFLGLGSKESLRFSKHSDDFIDFNRSERIYQKQVVV